MEEVILIDGKPAYAIYCDNYKICKQMVLHRGTTHATETRARVAGWHIYHGQTIGGARHDAVLCPTCLGPSHRSATRSTDPLPGQEGLWAA